MKASIAIVADPFEVVHGGIENQARILFNMMKSYEYNVTFIDYRKLNAKMLSSYEIIIIEGIRRKKLLLNLLFSNDKSFKILFTHGSFYIFSKSRRQLVRLTQSRLLFTLQLLFDKVFMKAILRKFDIIVTLSDSETKDLISLFGLEPDKMLDSIYLSDEFINNGGGTYERQDLPHSYASYVGRLERRKNLIELLKACHELDIDLVIAGQDMGSLKELQEYCRNNNFKKFHYLGVISNEEKFKVISSSSAIVIPSFFEGIPTLALEAIKLKKYVVMTKNAYMSPHKCIIFSETDHTSLALAIKRAMELGSCDACYETNDSLFKKLIKEIENRRGIKLNQL